MYHSGKNPLRKVTYKSDAVTIVKSEEQRRLHKAFLRYHDPKGWPMLREALTRMGRADLIGPGKEQLIPLHQPSTDSYQSARRKNSTPAGSHKVAKETTTRILTQHTGLPPRGSDGSNPWDKREQAKAAAQARNKQAAKERSDAAKGKGGKPARKPVVPR
jgi:hypothetical protein